jgi:hypothetical protein
MLLPYEYVYEACLIVHYIVFNFLDEFQFYLAVY